MAQHDEHPDIQGFLEWVRRNSEYAVHDPNAEERRAFIPLRTVREHFKEEGGARLKELLVTIFAPDDPPIDPDDILENYTQIFCILIEIGKCRFIRSFASWGYGDRMLPFDPDHPPPSFFPTDTTDPKFYVNFCNKQWKFCVPELKSPMTNIRFHQDRILPIVSKDRITGGGSAILYKIKLQSSYNRLGPQSTYPNKPPTNTYALKTYLTPEAKRYYENEVAAFRRLKHLPNSGLIGFYGCYIQAHTFNVILEFADQGTLEQYFRNTTPPVRGDDIMNFWNGMFTTIGALKCIHDVGGRGPNEGPQILHGFHQDVKPTNILVTSNKVSSPYKWEFKVADLGLSHFKKVVDEQGTVTANDAHGTRAYGAPECYRGDEFLEQANLTIKQNVDIWSLGGVFSEAAIWVAHGYNGLLEYRTGRKEETDRIVGFRDGDCFHDGEKVLRAVGKWHQDIFDILRKSDNITTSVLSVIENDMLVTSDARATATQLWHKSRTILEKARQQIASPGMPTTDPLGFASRETSPLQPPEMPPSFHPPPRPDGNHQTPSKQSQGRVSFSSSSDHYDARREPSPDRVTTTESESSNRRDRNDTYDGLNGPKERSPYPGRRSQRSESESHQERSRASGSHGNLPYHHQRASEQQSRSGYLERQSRASILDSENGVEYDRRSQGVTEPYREDDSSHQNIGEGSNPRRSRSKRIPPERLGALGALPQVEEGSGDSFDDVNGIPAGLRNNRKPGPNRAPIIVQNHVTEQPIPYLSVSQASSWKAQRQAQKSIGLGSLKFRLGSSPDQLPHQYLQKRLKERDHAFLIDDSASVAKYWQELTSLVGVLAYIVKSGDPDGIEMYYTISDKSIKSKDSSVLVKSVQRTTPQGVSDIGMGLAAILGQYNLKLEKTLGSTAVTAVDDIRPLSLYVLTDGAWQPDSDAETPIKDVVRNLLKQRKLNKKQVGIQFVRFGNNPAGIAKLQKLDDEITLKESEGQLDIVDTEPSNGNIWKMLLGAIDPWFDRGGPPSHQPGSSSSTSYH